MPLIKKKTWAKIRKNLLIFYSKKFIKKLEDLTNKKGLIADQKLETSGAHIVKNGGYLNIHTDFVSHIINSKWRRKLNLLLYLNKNWKKVLSDLEFWDEKENKISICKI